MSRSKRRILGAATLLGLCLGAAAATTMAQSFPNRAVKIMVPATPGTGADVVARMLGQRLSDAWGQPVVIENQAGASGNLGMAVVAKSPPDGYTLVLAFLNHAINPSLFQSVPFDLLRDFKPIVNVATVPLVFIAHPSFPANSINELLALAKTRSGPNRINFGTSGTGSVLHLAFELLKSKTGIDLVHVPYKGTAAMVQDLVGNHIPLGAPAIPTALPLLQGGRIKVLAVTTSKRSAILPNIPTVEESGIPDFDVSAWEGLLAPANTPDSIISKIYDDVVVISRDKDFVSKLNAGGLDLLMKNPAEYRQFLASELEKWARLVKASGAKAE